MKDNDLLSPKDGVTTTPSTQPESSVAATLSNPEISWRPEKKTALGLAHFIDLKKFFKFWVIPIASNKHPLAPNWNKEELELTYTDGQLYGIVAPTDLMIADVDIKNGKPGLESWNNFVADNHLDPKLAVYPAKSCNVITGSGGFHFYIRLAEGVDYRQIPKICPRYPGIDFLIHGKSYAVAGGQQLDNGWYWQVRNFAIESLTSLDCFGTQRHTPTLQSAEPTPSVVRPVAQPSPTSQATSYTPPTPPPTLSCTASKYNPMTGEVGAAGGRTLIPLDKEQVDDLLALIPSDDYEVWIRVAWALMSTQLTPQDKNELWHKWSSTSEKYSHDDAESKWRSLSADHDEGRTPTAGSLVHLAKQYAKTGEELEKIFSVIFRQDVDNLRGRIYRVASFKGDNKYYDLFTQSAISKDIVMVILDPLIQRYTEINKKKADVHYLLKNGDIPIVHDMVYAPGESFPTFVSLKSRIMLNSYHPDNIPPTIPYENSEIVDFFVHQVREVWGKGAEPFLCFIAHLVQKPGKKPRWMPVLEGGKGTGKGLILSVIKNHVLGAENCSIINSNEILSEYNGWAFDRQLIHIDEMYITGKNAKACMNTQKSLITEDVVTRREKYLTVAALPNYAAFIALTNHRDALRYADERRYYAIISPIRTDKDLDLRGFKSSREYFDYLASLADKNNPRGGEFRHFFLNYPIPDSFSIDVRPMESDYEFFRDAANNNPETEEFIELALHAAGAETLPPYLKIAELADLSVEPNPATGARFFEEALAPRKIKTYGRRLSYVAYSGWLYSSVLKSEKAQERIKRFCTLKYTTADAAATLHIEDLKNLPTRDSLQEKDLF